MRLNNPLLKNLLPGLIPLFIFIIAEEIWGLKTGLFIAIIFGIGEFIYTFIRTKRIEKFILTDILLLTTLGAISIILENDIFFKLKPALIEFILAVIIGISVFSPKNLVLSMSARYLKNMQVNDAMQMQLNKSLKIILFITIGHIALIIYSSYYLSDEAWAFISGGLFYILFIGYFIYEYSKNKLKNLKYRKEEWLPIVNEKGELIGKKPRSLCHHKKNKPLHPVVHLHVFNKSHKLFLQKRPISKDIQPGKWDTSVGGHISFGEDIETTLLRETQEEIGLKEFKANFITQYIWESDAEREFIFMFYTITDNKLNININEVEEGKYWKYKEIEENLEKGVFTPNFEYEYNILKNIIKKLEE